MPTAVRSHAKINLGLAIGAPRADGFHSLVTVYQTLEMHDRVTVSARRTAQTAIRITSNDWRVPTDQRNTAWKMVSLALEGLRITAEVDIHIEKRLPVQGGLGAGSANAVAALMGLESELDPLALDSSDDLIRRVIPPDVLQKRGLNLEPPSPETLQKTRPLQLIVAELKWAEQVGSDVPLFLVGGTVLGEDRGQAVSRLPDIEPVWCLVATPSIGVSTPQAFRDWDALCARDGLTTEASADRLEQLSRAYASAFAGSTPQGRQGTGSSGVPSSGGDLAGPQESALVRTGILSWIQNDFEKVVFPQHPSLREIKQILSGCGSPEAALHASLSGSGSALFGLYLAREHAEAAAERLRAAGVKSLLTRTLPRPAYWGGMLLQSED
jgi:4-diphosphocytidyl-2-C-methyl-D-erythritol kinase